MSVCVCVCVVICGEDECVCVCVCVCVVICMHQNIALDFVLAGQGGKPHTCNTQANKTVWQYGSVAGLDRSVKLVQMENHQFIATTKNTMLNQTCLLALRIQVSGLLLW